MRKFLFPILLTVLTMVACGGQQTETTVTAEAIIDDSVENSDSAIYGLVCDGTNDTLLVVLTDISADPDTFDILDVSRRHNVYGRLLIGDRVAVVLDENGEWETESRDRRVERVIDVDQLKAMWAYRVTPTLRQRADVSKKMEKEFLERVPDSVLQRLLQPREYGFELKNDGAARPIGMVHRGNTSDQQSPVVYPELKRYREWALSNGRLVLSETRMDSLGQRQVINSDTADLVLLMRDSLVLRFADGEQSYYRKTEKK